MIPIIIRNILSQLVFFVGAVFLAGFIISLLNRVFYRLVGAGRVTVYLTGIIGTPIHELSHAAFCILFGHRITDMSLFRIDDRTGVLGYVNHAYNPRNPYHVLGNYFIGVAPLILGGGAILLLMKHLIPAAYIEFDKYIDAFVMLSEEGISANWFAYCYGVMRGMLSVLISLISTDAFYWIFILLALCISLHMTLSGADIKGSLGALPILLLILAGMNFGIGLSSVENYISFLATVNSLGAYLCSMLLVAILMSSVLVIVGLLIHAIRRILHL